MGEAVVGRAIEEEEMGAKEPGDVGNVETS